MVRCRSTGVVITLCFTVTVVLPTEISARIRRFKLNPSVDLFRVLNASDDDLDCLPLLASQSDSQSGYVVSCILRHVAPCAVRVFRFRPVLAAILAGVP
jgi:hypothetical protein